MASDQMPKFDQTKDKNLINKTAFDYMRLVEKQNQIRVEKLKLIKKRNNITGLVLGGIVVAIYSYSILAVGQETFLDDFEKPVLLPKKQNN